ncbi:MAG TPA: DUF167 domain-containing protein [Candidatus Nanoarchaeia archaeon]|nr:DUF167 domain-containing protein [Candidatus Nanoarchaeia archaeon]
MNIEKHTINNKIALKVIPNSSKLKLVEDNQQLKLYLTAPSEDNKANLQLIKFFKKEFNLKVMIVSGLKSRNKIIKLFR